MAKTKPVSDVHLKQVLADADGLTMPVQNLLHDASLAGFETEPSERQVLDILLAARVLNDLACKMLGARAQFAQQAEIKALKDETEALRQARSVT